ncbi:MAG TPA: pseudouridine synthase, partial [Nevskiaceae bacterium]|nr:pseudouridine synthase [Nevskiaceae bacterium]
MKQRDTRRPEGGKSEGRSGRTEGRRSRNHGQRPEGRKPKGRPAPFAKPARRDGKVRKSDAPRNQVVASAGAAGVHMEVRKVEVGAREDGQRIDNFLLRQLPGVPKSHVYRLLRSGQVRINGGRAKPERKLASGDEVRIPPVRMAEKGAAVRPPDAVLNRLREAIVYEDANYLALNKPAGFASHGGTGIPFGVIEAARAWGKHEFLELAHRLDRDTSGLLLLCKTRPALLRAQRAFKEGLAQKRYFALLCGRWSGGERDVDAALVRNRLASGERYVEIDEEDGKPSHSRFTPQARYRDATLCEVEIFSGRTHQIRVHALAL